ncbi:DUF1727 domain-containing protein [Bifidobacterium sp. LC6]|uniref:Lipid II isoglutaminyl synthase (glutamine-hydrolyzing) subunit MurT n=1 Tax=Bifidobacterium colobi TaxID=2809026 RepID=A0ABS5UUU7_9BIFI|nr:Mur ligase family protein [Bifidobacterium colobi]MBT1174832.1 DUF1727 domain-containing protein [Bifidobacterium colobi]
MFFEIALGRFLKQLAKIKGTGGSAFPGHVLEQIDPDFMKKALSQVRKGIVVIVGTNGKTTTSRLIAEILRAHGYKVFNNPTGSNWIRGVNSSLLDYLSPFGKLDADYAVVELDEGHSNRFIKHVTPNWCVVLNVQRDQLDRFGELDATAQLLRNVVASCDRGVTLNHDDERIAALSDAAKVPVSYFRLADDLKSLFPSDSQLYDSIIGESDDDANKEDKHQSADDVELTAVGDQKATFTIDGKPFETAVGLEGAYNQQNAAAAIAVTKRMLGSKLNLSKVSEALASMTPAFGRAERVMYKGQPLELIIVKNPAGFRVALNSFASDGWATMTINNDTYADGRDMSWIWDVDMSPLRDKGVQMVAGTRAEEMALRLAYEDVHVDAVEHDFLEAFHHFCDAHPNEPKRIYGSYTGTLGIRIKILEPELGLESSGIGIVDWE